MRCRVLVSALISACVLSGCASWFTSSTRVEPTPLQAVRVEQPLKLKWSDSVGDVAHGGFLPVYQNGNVVVAEARGHIEVFDALSGRKVSELALKRELSAGPGVTDTLVLVPTTDGRLLAVDRSSGAVRWEQMLTSLALEAPQAGSEVVTVRTNDGRVTGFALADGKQLWSVSRVLPQLTVENNGSLQRAGDEAILAGQAGGRLVVLSPKNGNVLWEASVASPRGATELERVTDVVSRPVFDAGQVCAVAFQGRVACFEARGGNLLWARDVSSSHGLAVDARNVYVTGDDGSLWAFDRSTGRNIWKLDDLKYRNVSGPAMLGRYVLVTDGEGYAHLVAADSGRIVGRTKVGTERLTGQPVSLGDTALVLGRNGRLAMLSLE